MTTIDDIADGAPAVEDEDPNAHDELLFGAEETRRAHALGFAMQAMGDKAAFDHDLIVKAAKAFEAYLKG